MGELSREDLESTLTDVRAEMCLLEAELRRLDERASDAGGAVERPAAGAHSTRRLLIRSRLDQLDATSAGLRARLERLGGDE